MSIDDTTPVDTDEGNLDDFSAEFFGQSKAEPEATTPEVDEATNDGADAEPKENTQEQPDDPVEEKPAEESDDEDDDQEEEDANPKPKESRFQKRISELTAKARDAERREQALLDRLTALEAGSTKTEAPKPADTVGTGDSPPAPNDTNEDGTERFPLGEFDPEYIAALTQYNVDKVLAARDERTKQEAETAKRVEAAGQLEAAWTDELVSARERYPDFDEKGEALGAMLTNLDQGYGDYLGSTIMGMDKGADVLYYLAQNPEEAVAIVNSGPQKATIALGRLEARFSDAGGTTVAPRKVSTAPTPPPANKGSSVARGRVAPDTDDLDAFANMFFDKKK